MTNADMQQGIGGAASWLDGSSDSGAGSSNGIGAATNSTGSAGGHAHGHGGWTAPVKPALFPLRPLGFGDIFAATFRLLRTSPAVTIGSAMIVLSVTTIISTAATALVAYAMFTRAASAAPSDRADLEATAVTVTMLTALSTIIFSLLGSALLQGILAHVVARGALGEKITFGSAWRVAFRRVWPLCG
ncbi:MAG: hypothetical protein ACTH31_11540 [Pseudoclavibacter sp.]